MIRIAIDVSKAEQLVIGIPILGLINKKVLDVIADPDPIKSSVKTNITFFLIKLFYFLL